MSTIDLDYPFESFNARSLSPRQVAKGFVPPENFKDLCKRRHTLIAGPRGSGKTTLLKMLQVSALREWTHPDADTYRQQIDFTSVFIPADRCWGDQISAIGKGHLSETQQQVLGIAAFTTQVLRALVTSVLERRSEPSGSSDNRSFRPLSFSSEQEVMLARQVAVGWRIVDFTPSLHGLRIALACRLAEIHQIGGRCALLSEDARNALLAESRFLHLSFVSAVGLFLDIFESVTGNGEEKWALLFDELELAPKSIRETLAYALRSVDQRLVFKLSIAPFSRELEDSISAAIDKNDFDLVRLWYASKEDGYPFSRALIRQILAQRGFPEVQPEQILGWTEYEEGGRRSRGRKGEYHLVDVFRRLARKDQSFGDYLREKMIDLRDSGSYGENERAALLRKVAPLVVVRDTYRAEPDALHEESGRGRSRKSASIYCGVPALLAVCEGNPRWLIGLTDALLDKVVDGRVPIAVQNQELSSLLSRFSAFLRTIPCNGFGLGEKSSVYRLIESIGDWFTEEVVFGPFNADPAGTIAVDSHTTDEQLRALEQAIYAGALVFVPETANDVPMGSIRGKRFRLAYLLAPKYKLPLVLLREKSMSTILNESRRRSRRSDPDPAQVGMF